MVVPTFHRVFVVIVILTMASGTAAGIPDPGPGEPPPLPTPPTPDPAPTPPTPAPGTPAPGDTSSNGGGGGGIAGAISAAILSLVRTLGVDQPIQAAQSLLGVLFDFARYTPHANGIGRWFHAPTNNVWPDNWSAYQTRGRPAWIITLVIGGALGLIFHTIGSLTGQEFTEWRRRWVVGLLVGGWAWEFSNLYLFTLDAVKAWIVSGMNPSTAAVTGPWATATILVLLVAIAIINLWAILLVAGIIAMTVVGIDILTPYLGVLLAARAIPLRFINGPADKVARFWAILPLLTIPMLLALSVGFSSGMDSMLQAHGFAKLVTPLIHIGSFLLAVALPVLVWTGASGGGTFATGFAGGAGGVALSQRYQQAKDRAAAAKQKGTKGVRGARNAARGARGKAPVADGGKRAYEAGAAARQTSRTYSSNRVSRVKQRVSRFRSRGGRHETTGRGDIPTIDDIRQANKRDRK